MNERVAERTKVLMVDAMSGNNDFAVALCQTLAPLCELSVFTVENTQLREEAGIPSVIRAWPRFGGGLNLSVIRKLVVALPRLVGQLWRHRKATVHSQFLRFPLLETLVFLLARPFIQTFIITAHNATPHEPSRWLMLLLRIWYRLPDRIVVLSHNVRREIVAQFDIPEERIEVIPHGNYASLREACRNQTPADWVSDVIRNVEGQVMVLMFGYIRSYKGVDTLIAAAGHLFRDSPWHVLVAGGGPSSLVDCYNREINANGLEDKITIVHQFLPNKDLAALLERADVLVFPYRDMSQSGALLLGMSFGKPCVCSDLPGFHEYLREDEAIFFPEAEAEARFATAMTRLIDDPALRRRLGAASSSAAEERYSWSQIADAYLRVYSEAAART